MFALRLCSISSNTYSKHLEEDKEKVETLINLVGGWLGKRRQIMAPLTCDTSCLWPRSLG